MGRPSLSEIVRTFGLDLEQDAVQLVPLPRVNAAAQAAPFESGLLPISSLMPLIVHRGESSETAPETMSALATTLSRQYGSTARFEVLAKGQVSSIALTDLTGVDGFQALYAAPVGPLVSGTDPRAMQQIVARLRRPDGCPWDRKQTYSTLAKNLVDEVYEAVDAINAGDIGNLAEELGDLFLLLLMLAQIAHEAGDFTVEDVYAGIAGKIVGRHPHVFGDDIVETDADLAGVWAEAKAREAAETGKRGGKDVDGEPFSMPALTRAMRVLKKQPVVDSDVPDFLRIVGELVQQGEDPDAVLREQLRAHVQQMVARQST